MKKLLLITTLALILAFAVVGLASANNGPHGGYTPTTDACAGCHRAHTASCARLLLEDDITTFCLVCHGDSGSGADTSVTLGRYVDRDSNQVGEPAGEDAFNNPGGAGNESGLLGGGFNSAWDFTDQAYETTTSKHDVGVGVTTVWGGKFSGISQTEALQDGLTFDCADCHNPHGNSNYRILKQANSMTKTLLVPQVDEANKSYITETWDITPSTQAGISTFCGGCHFDYHQVISGSGQSTAVFVGNVATYTHRIDMSWNGDADTAALAAAVDFTGALTPDGSSPYTYSLRLADDLDNSVNNDIVVCTTCHYAHGSASQMGSYSEGATLNDIGGAGNSSALLYLDNRGVCQVCHQK